MRILVVEDEAVIALDLVCGIEDAGGWPVGPAFTVAEGLQMVEHDGIQGAIVDANLKDGHVGPLLDVLTRREIPVIVLSGLGLPREIRERFGWVKVYSKPTPVGMLIRDIASKVRRGCQVSN